MITNIDDFKKDFIKAPKKLIENPKTNKDYLNNLYYKLSTLFHNFSKNDILDMFTPESFYYDNDLNLFASIRLDSLNFTERDKLFHTKWSTTNGTHYITAIINYWFAKDKFLLTLNESLSCKNDYKIVKPFEYDVMFYNEQCNYEWFYDWNELRPKTDELIAQLKKTLDTHKFFVVDTFGDLQKNIKEHNLYSIDILESYEIVGNLYFKINNKRFNCDRNELDYKSGYWSKNYQFDETISFAQLLNNPNYVEGFNEDFVKECVAYYEKKKVQDEIDEIDDDIKAVIKRLESEISKLQRQLEKNKPKVKRLQTKKNKIKGKDIKLNLEIPKKKNNGNKRSYNFWSCKVQQQRIHNYL